MKVRQIKEEDLPKFTGLFNEAYRGYSMYNVRTPELYPCFLSTEGKEYMFVVEEGENLLGYVAMGIRKIGSSALISIYELVASSKNVYNELIEKVEELGNEKGVAIIEMLAPAEKGPANYLIDDGFLETKPLATMVHLFDTKRVLRLFSEEAFKNRSFKKDLTILFRVDKENIQITLPEGGIGYCTDSPDIEVVVSPHNLLSLLLKKSSCLSLFIKRKMKVAPVYKVMTVCAIFDYLAKDMKMIVPFSEVM